MGINSDISCMRAVCTENRFGRNQDCNEVHTGPIRIMTIRGAQFMRSETGSGDVRGSVHANGKRGNENVLPD